MKPLLPALLLASLCACDTSPGGTGGTPKEPELPFSFTTSDEGSDLAPDLVVGPDLPGDTGPDAPGPDAPGPDAPETPDPWCRLQTPESASIAVGTEIQATGRVFVPGITDQSAGSDPDPSLSVQVGWGPDGGDPTEDDAGWAYAPASPKIGWVDGPDPGADEYSATFTAPAAGQWDVAFRFSVDGGASWTWCDGRSEGGQSDGSKDGYQPAMAGALTTSGDPCDPNPCVAPPEPECEGTVLTTWSGPGSCEVADGAATCAFNPTTLDCAASGQACEGGACTAGPPGGAPAPGQVIFTEIMQNPAAVGDGDGEWLELKNVSGTTLDLDGCEIGSGNDSTFLIATGSPVQIPAGGYLVFAANTAAGENGGLPADYGYASLNLANGDDSVELRCQGAQIDAVSWDDGATFPDPTGASMQLDPAAESAVANDSGANWCEATAPYGSGDLGTPGAANTSCTSDPCAGVVCDAPPEPTCEGDLVQTYVALGTCSDGGCSYPVESTFDCAMDDLMCQGGACVDPPSGPAPAPGEVILTELMVNPAAVGDTEGEWLELENLAATEVSLDGCVLGSDQDSGHTIGPLSLAPGAIVVLGRNADDAINGGLSVDEAYGSALQLSNTSDSLSLSCDSTLIDAVAWDDGATFPDPEGAAMQLAPGAKSASANDQGANWCAAPSPYGAGDLGSPGVANPACDLVDPCPDPPCEDPVAPAPGQVVITEIMQNPAAVGDEAGEWFELYNLGPSPALLDGCAVDSKNDAGFTIGAVTLPAGAYLVLGVDASTATNGGVPVDLVAANIQLNNSSDDLSLSCGGQLIDLVAYDDGATFPDPSGASMQLDPASYDATANDSGGQWCEATATYGQGDKGTPGGDNQACN